MTPLSETDKSIIEHDERISRLESKILGDSQAGRPSLRQDMERSMKRQSKFLYVILAMLLTIFGTLLVDRLRPTQAHAQDQEQHQAAEK